MRGDQLIRELNEPARVLAEELFRRFPAWMDFVEVNRVPDPYGAWQPGSLIFHIPSPVVGRDHWLEAMVQGDTFLTSYTFSDPRRPWEGTFIIALGEEREA